MAGSYNHIIADNGAFIGEAFTNSIDNLGDAYEMAEELFGMIWWLASHSPDPAATVEDARQHYRDGLDLAPQ